jgi:hypothetical protein
MNNLLSQLKRYNTIIKYFLILIIGLSNYSCVSYKIINIQTLKPSEFSLPKDFNQPLIVVSLYKGIEGDEESMALAAMDSIAALEAALTLSDKLYESPWFQDIDIPLKAIYRNDSSNLILPFSWAKAKRIAEGTNADMLISLEYFKLDFSVISFPFWNGTSDVYYGSLTNRVYAYWRVYDLNAEKVMADYLYKDTLVWEKYDYTKVKVGDQIPGFFASASYSGYITGLEYAKKIAPTWMDEERVYFHKGSKEMRNAVAYVTDNQWINAASEWQRVLGKEKVNPKLASKAAYNMAVANEMLGNFDVAIEWLNKSAQYKSLPEEPWYRKIITLRMKLLENL